MEAEEQVPKTLDQLAKRRKLIDPRKKTFQEISKEKKDDSNPVTLYSNAQSSISPPSYSPLTPLVMKSVENKEKGEIKANPDLQSHTYYNISDPLNSPSLLTNEQGDTTPLSSPLRSMTPETLQLFNMLAEDEEMTEIINDLQPNKAHHCDSDDSVKDPNYSLANEPKNIEKSSSSCSSLKNNGSKLVSSSTELVNDEETNIDEGDLVTNIPVRPKKGRKQRHPQLRHVHKYKK